MAKEKVNFTIDEKLLQEVDKYCDKNFMNRSWFISQSLVKSLNEQKVVDALVNMSVCMRKIADTGKVDSKTIEQLEDFERIAKLFYTGIGGK